MFLKDKKMRKKIFFIIYAKTQLNFTFFLKKQKKNQKPKA